MKHLFLLAAFATTILTATAQKTVYDQHAEVRPVTSFHAVQVSHAFEVVITQGAEEALAVSSTKSLLGHTLGASGALEAVATVLSLRDGVVHPSRNLDEPIAPLAFPTRATSLPLRHALSQSFAFGGQNAVLALRALG